MTIEVFWDGERILFSGGTLWDIDKWASDDNEFVEAENEQTFTEGAD